MEILAPSQIGVAVVSSAVLVVLVVSLFALGLFGTVALAVFGYLTQYPNFVAEEAS